MTQLPISPAAGLTCSEAQARLASDGPNELASGGPRSIWAIAWQVLQEPMLFLLVGCGAVYLALGEPREAAVLLVFVLVVMGITLYQERRTERALEALRDLASPRALVIRDGQRLRIAGRDVVRGDWVVLGEGDRVPADGVLVDASHLKVDESLLTGESVPVRKRVATVVDTLERPGERAGGDGSPCVYAGTLVVSGHGIARIEATGAHTEMGRIGYSLRTISAVRSPLQEQTARMVQRFALAAGALCLLLVVFYGATRGNWLEASLAGIALAMSLLPQEFTVVLVVYLALGAWRLTRHNVLARRAAAVESLGATTVLCVDKTGTLTENRMTVRMLVNASGEAIALDDAPLPERFHPLVEFALLATRSDVFDPMERAINALGLGRFVDAAHLHEDWELVREYPLSSELLAMSQVWNDRRSGARVIAAKGAPEAIAELCHLDAARTQQVLEQVRTHADQGLRVLAVARAQATHASAQTLALDAGLPEVQHAFEFEFLGLVGLADPVRASVPDAVAACRRAGIRVLMITGDYPGTAEAVARQAGFAPGGTCVTGPELGALDDAALRERLKTVAIVARAVPEQKLRIVQALQANGEVVAMTGDGVNDAPALQAADIGVAMGGRGTDVAREAADLVVTDDDFGSIVHGVRLGRRIFDNLKRAIVYIVAVHLPIAGMAVLPVLFGWPLVLLPAHIAFLEIIIDPACAVVFEDEPESRGTMDSPPRRREESLLSARGLVRGIAQGLVVSLVAVGVYLWARSAGLTEEMVRGMTFVMLVLGNLVLILGNRSHTQSVLSSLAARNRAFWWIVGGTLACLALVLFVPALSDLFRLQSPGAQLLLACVGVTALLMLALDGVNRGINRLMLR
jgi:Ca2+-transporting ATPase